MYIKGGGKSVFVPQDTLQETFTASWKRNINKEASVLSIRAGKVIRYCCVWLSWCGKDILVLFFDTQKGLRK